MLKFAPYFLASRTPQGFITPATINPRTARPFALGPSPTTMSTTITTTINTKDYQLHEGDTGSAPYQVALLTQRIFQLTDHLNIHTKDFSSRRGLLKLVARRRKMLDYIKAGSDEKYLELIKALGLRR